MPLKEHRTFLKLSVTTETYSPSFAYDVAFANYRKMPCRISSLIVATILK